jgi:hypothetical protein
VKIGTTVPVTKENTGAISLLAKELWLEDFLSECSALQKASIRELITPLQLEHHGIPLAIVAGQSRLSYFCV